MRMLPFSTTRISAFTFTIVLMVGCASKKPFIDTPSDRTAIAPANIGIDGSGAVRTVKHRRLFGIFSPYRVDIQQGNFVSKEMIAQIQVGMTREQVQFVLGTPLLTDLFHADRWDYVFRLQKGNGELTTSRVSMFFENNVLTRIDGGELPTESDYLTRISGDAQKSKVNKTSTIPVN